MSLAVAASNSKPSDLEPEFLSAILSPLYPQ